MPWLGIPEEVHELCCLAREEGPQVLFLIETKLDTGGFQRLKRSLVWNKGVEVSRIGIGGGLALLWQDDADLKVLTQDPYHIDALLLHEGILWRFIDFYGHLET